MQENIKKASTGWSPGAGDLVFVNGSVTYHEVTYAFLCFVLTMNTYLLGTSLVSADIGCCTVV